ncbi:hypothetical protein AB5J62_20640 [Amycolatopsis sp. cg5]|uniref:hypothetical protein n=1 Tax=Amycolatopsis sp. cg5 TaxID=3238802 RepID=UPI0035231A66
MSTTRFAVGLVAAMALTLGVATTAQAVERPPGGRSRTDELGLKGGVAAATVSLTWSNGYHGRSFVRWSTTRAATRTVVDVEIDGHVTRAFDGLKEKTDGTIIERVRVRVCDTSDHCGSWV